jgi:hypothetical protein
MLNPGYSSSTWRAQVPQLLTIAVEGTLPQRRLAVTLLARELAGHFWSSVWRPGDHHFALVDLGISPDAGPELIVRSSYVGGGGSKAAEQYAGWGAEGGARFPTGYARRMVTEPQDDGTNRNYPAASGPPGQAEITADCITRAAALIAEMGP